MKGERSSTMAERIRATQTPEQAEERRQQALRDRERFRAEKAAGERLTGPSRTR